MNTKKHDGLNIHNGQKWKCRGKKAVWTVWGTDDNGFVWLTRMDILNPGMGGKRYEKYIHREELMKRYEVRE